MKGIPKMGVNSTGDKKRYMHYYAFQKKNTIIRYIEVIGAIAIVLIVVGGITGYFN